MAGKSLKILLCVLLFLAVFRAVINLIPSGKI
jgi:hypothetical protein